jgi:hypothetical protein
MGGCKEKIKKSNPKKVKVKRSFQEIFRKLEVKRNEKPANLMLSKRASNAGSTFSQRFKDSTTFSKSNLYKSAELTSETHRDATSEKSELFGEEGSRNAALSALEAGSSSPARNSCPPSFNETATVINNIVDRVTSMEKSSPDRLRGVEIAEVCDAHGLCWFELDANKVFQTGCSSFT